MTRVHTRHARMTLREMQLPPAETHQPVDEPVITIRFGLCLALLTAVLIGAHWTWVSRLPA